MSAHKTIPLVPARLADMPATKRHSLCSASQVGNVGGCGIANNSDTVPNHIWDKIKDHPCYSEAAHHHFARIHLAVAPACNIQCNYCNRKYDCSNESRPGVVSEKITPEQAVRKVLAVASKVPQLSVVGIAGPGDALANAERTFRTLELIGREASHIKFCLSTNGLLLPDYVERIHAMKIDHVTVTVNMIDPEIGQQIYPWIFFRNRRWTGRDASMILSEQQMKGIEMLAERGILCKVNSVMIPGINDVHLIDVNRAVQSRGAFMHNIMPLISAPEHGTEFGLRGQRGPSAGELKSLQDHCEGSIKMMRHCRQCRADAIGLLGQDLSADYTQDKIDSLNIAYDADAHRLYLENLLNLQQQQTDAAKASLSQLGAAGNSISILLAVATKGHGRVNQHFGHAHEFHIYEVSSNGAHFVGHRRVDSYCQGGYDDDEVLAVTLRALNDCHAVLVAKIGACPKEALCQAGIEAVESHDNEYIESAAMNYFQSYASRVDSGEISHQARPDACLRQEALEAAA